jgi:hypothetical protein
LSEYEVLIGDKRTGRTLQSVIEGIIGSESLKAVRIGGFSPPAGAEKECGTQGKANGKRREHKTQSDRC